jgi:hypothetical protein
MLTFCLNKIILGHFEKGRVKKILKMSKPWIGCIKCRDGLRSR